MDLVLIRHPAVDVPPGVCYGRTDVPLRPRPAARNGARADTSDQTNATRPSTSSTRQVTTETIDDALTAAVDAIAAHLRTRGVVHGCVTSPSRRCADVAHALMRGAPEIDPRLAELDFGDWEMQRWDDIPRHQIDAWAADIVHACPYRGESLHMLAERCGSWLRERALKAGDAALGENTALGADASECSRASDGDTSPYLLVIGHAGSIRVLTALALGLPLTATLQWPLDFGGVVTLAHGPAGAQEPSWTLRQWNG